MTREMTLAEWVVWAKDLAHINPSYVDAFAERVNAGWMQAPFRDAQGWWAIQMTQQEWLDQFEKWLGRSAAEMSEGSVN